MEIDAATNWQSNENANLYFMRTNTISDMQRVLTL